MQDIEERRQAFIQDIVEVCKRHQVIMNSDEFEEDCSFESAPDDGGYCFVVTGCELEHEIRKVVWDILYPPAPKKFK